MARGLQVALMVLLGAALVLLVASSVEQWIPGTRAEMSVPVLSAPTGRVRVDVRNAGGVSGMAASATDLLRETGYDVVDFGNASSFGTDSSVVIDRVGDLEMAAGVAQALGVTRVVSAPDSNLFVDVTVRLGADWSPGLSPRRRAAERSWMDRVRDLFRSR